MKGLSLKLSLALLGMLLFSASHASAGTICPAGSGSSPFPHSPDSGATGCNEVITIASNGTASAVIEDSTAYEESEDVLVGVVNNSSTSITSLSLTGNDIFGFDGDGVCTFTFVGDGYCTTAQQNGTDPEDYQGPTSIFSVTNGNNGTVNFNPGISANGGTSFFSLEGVPSVLGVTRSASEI
jgi:hypothetical protein